MLLKSVAAKHPILAATLTLYFTLLLLGFAHTLCTQVRTNSPLLSSMAHWARTNIASPPSNTLLTNRYVTGLLHLSLFVEIQYKSTLILHIFQ